MNLPPLSFHATINVLAPVFLEFRRDQSLSYPQLCIEFES